MESCSICAKEIIKPIDSCGTGYGKDKDGNIICYSCCGELDKTELLETGKFIGYLSRCSKDGNYYFSNWPSSLKIRINSMKQSWHNFAGAKGRTDFWFTFEGQMFHGVHVGHNNEIATVRKIKG